MGNSHPTSRCKTCSSLHDQGTSCPYKSPTRFKSSNFECYNCGGIGHKARDCDVVILPPSRPASEACKHCGGRHATSDCRQNIRRIVREEQKKTELEKKVEILEDQLKSMKVAEQEMKKKMEVEVSTAKSGESSPKENSGVNANPVSKSSTSQLNNDGRPSSSPENAGPTSFIGSPLQFNGPPQQQFLPPLLRFPQPQSYPTNHSFMQQPNPQSFMQQTNPNQGQWDSNKNQFLYQNQVPPVRPFGPPPPPHVMNNNQPPPLMNNNQPPPLMNNNQLPPRFNQHPQPFTPVQCQQQNPNSQQFNPQQMNRPFQGNQDQYNQNQNKQQGARNFQRGRGYGNMNRGSRGGRGQHSYNNNNAGNRNTGSSRGYASDSGRGRGNRERALFSGGEQKTSKKDDTEENNSDGENHRRGSKDNKSEDNRQKKDHQGVYRGGIRKDKQNVRPRGANKSQGPNRKDIDSNGDSDSTSTGYETALNEDHKNHRVRRNRKKKEAATNKESGISSIAELDIDTKDDAPKEMPLSKNNLGKGDILMKYIGSKLPTLADAVYDNVSLYQSVEGVMLLSDPESFEPIMESARNLLHIIEFKGIHPNAKSYFVDSKN